MTSGGFEVYNADYDVKLRFGYTTDDEDYPFIQLGSGSGASADYGLVKKFSDGLWIGNSEPEDESGDFAAKTGYNGIFFRFSDNTAYIVNGKTMKTSTQVRQSRNLDKGGMFPMAITPWSWTSSNGTATAAQTQAAYAAPNLKREHLKFSP